MGGEKIALPTKTRKSQQGQKIRCSPAKKNHQGSQNRQEIKKTSRQNISGKGDENKRGKPYCAGPQESKQLGARERQSSE